MAWRLWPGRLLFATFYFVPQDADLVADARLFMASLGPRST